MSDNRLLARVPVSRSRKRFRFFLGGLGDILSSSKMGTLGSPYGYMDA